MPRWFEAERAFIDACRAGAHHLQAVDSVDEKTCNKCKASKPRELFYRWAKSPDGRNYRCKACMQAEQKQRLTNRNAERRVAA